MSQTVPAANSAIGVISESVTAGPREDEAVVMIEIGGDDLPGGTSFCRHQRRR